MHNNTETIAGIDTQGRRFFGGPGRLILIVIVISLAVVVSKGFTVRLLRRVFRYMERVGAVTLMAAGSYIIYYWTLGTGGRQLLFAQ